ncbi:MAG TPA: polyphenol oxidase family protein [Gemmatimonadaceae bacterium]|nr:polyphenol oxidase family protein [Gemmatimonadaceae bacterium]
MGAAREEAPGFADLGVRAFTTTRHAGSFAWHSEEPAAGIMARWEALQAELRAAGAPRLASAHQVHGARVLEHDGTWDGLLRAHDADGHFSLARGTAMAVTLADCVPVFLAHPSGAAALLHSGWKGTEARIVEQGIAAFARHGLRAPDLRLHLGPAICGRCYEVSPDVHQRLTGRAVTAPAPVDLRAIIAGHARAAGVHAITISARCTRCDNADFFSHRAGDAGRQLAIIAAV